jgi:hypothetical protein
LLSVSPDILGKGFALPSVALGKSPTVKFFTVNRDLPRVFSRTLGKSFAEGQRGTRQRKVGRHGAGLFTANLPSAGPASTRQIRFYFFKKNCRVSRLQALGKSIFYFLKNDLPSAMT